MMALAANRALRVRPARAPARFSRREADLKASRRRRRWCGHKPVSTSRQPWRAKNQGTCRDLNELFQSPIMWFSRLPKRPLRRQLQTIRLQLKARRFPQWDGRLAGVAPSFSDKDDALKASSSAILGTRDGLGAASNHSWQCPTASVRGSFLFSLFSQNRPDRYISCELRKQSVIDPATSRMQ
jgi:hypothetical protein